MATDYLSAVGANTIVVHQLDALARARLVEYLSHKGYRALPVASIAVASETAQRERADVVIVEPTTAAADVAACATLRRGGAGPALVALCARGPGAELARLDETARPELIVLQPAPMPQVLAAVEDALLRHGASPTGSGDGALAFARLLLQLAVQRQTGRLRLTARGVQTTILWRAGIPVFAEEGSLGQTLGRQLLSSGKITREQFEQAVALITSDIVENEQMRLGEALVALGVLTSAEVMEALAKQVHEKIVACFAWERFHADFSAGEDHLAEVIEFPQALESVVVEGVKTVPLEALAAGLAPHGAGYALLSQHGWNASRARLGLTAREEAFVTSLTGQRTVNQACAAAQLDRIHARQVLTVLLLLGLVTLHDAAISASSGPGAGGGQPDDGSAGPTPGATMPAAAAAGDAQPRQRRRNRRARP
ncbi:MAG: hypothetical protein IPL40_07990 [Proteobacteria bacterium]|nr:hypothetical protein [Pseudomonadota bacterium]